MASLTAFPRDTGTLPASIAMSRAVEFNSSLLAGISRDGLLSSRAHTLPSIKSADVLDSYEPSSCGICCNVITPPTCSHEDTNFIARLIDDLLHSPFKGLFPVVAERPKTQATSRNWVFFENDNAVFAQKISSIFASSVLFQIDYDSIFPEGLSSHVDDSNLIESEGLVIELGHFDIIHPSAFVKAFVPANLESLFRGHFPSLECVVLPSHEERVLVKMPFSISKNPYLPRDSILKGFEKEISLWPEDPKIRDYYASIIEHRSCTADLPNYKEAVTRCFQEHFGVEASRPYDPTALAQKKPLIFHFVRLACPSDAPFLPKETEYR